MTSESTLILGGYVDAVEKKLTKILSCDADKDITEVMDYSLSAGGKRIRPALTLDFCRICGGNVDNALSAAAAIEMIHTFSLIHDDLPCMDNDDFRRGKPSCHKEFGEAKALLAGDALENLAFGTIMADDIASDNVKVKLISELSMATKRMIDGQVTDLYFEDNADKVSEKTLLEMYGNKTCALLECACVMGCICAEADGDKTENARKFAEKLGLAFQIVDDILDIVGDEKMLGKPIGSDAEQNKKTYAALVGVENAKKRAAELTEDAYNILGEFDNNQFLMDLTKSLLVRKK